MESEKTTHFGYRDVPETEKSGLVSDVFHSVANKYDLMNDLMSFGAHRLWKRFAIRQARVRKGQQVLDVAGGTGDMTALFAKEVGSHGRVTLSDINPAMLQQGRNRLLDQGLVSNIDFVLADAENLPFPEGSFDCVCIAFGLRNVTHIDRALASMQKVLKPGGRIIILEFSHPAVPGLDKLYDAYSFNILPKLGKLVANDEASYQYLVESIRKHPDQETLKSMMDQAGFARCHYFNLAGGIVALHKAYKI
ncbi:MAG: bifunctional demethylmenaquinone methyltransferase/2-methoxy-6-polyprenyl-1,4-benzoquinol methylase UbiE [Gammaproteobacteria bacterium]|nr:MAG: bifunctional demethylmenaquinone methyltransferase/2-methoxy-6-polyprenyl-1,4-benzoquinol methylase UbiE [Gammaproteobacteria bacterium]